MNDNRVLYLCDPGKNIPCSKSNCGYFLRKSKSEECCYHTTNIRIAKNFEKINGIYTEKRSNAARNMIIIHFIVELLELIVIISLASLL